MRKSKSENLAKVKSTFLVKNRWKMVFSGEISNLRHVFVKVIEYFFHMSLHSPDTRLRMQKFLSKMKMLQKEQTSKLFLAPKTLQNSFSFVVLISFGQRVFKKKEDFVSLTPVKRNSCRNFWTKF